jgi:hypothetical protein
MHTTDWLRSRLATRELGWERARMSARLCARHFLSRRETVREAVCMSTLGDRRTEVESIEAKKKKIRKNKTLYASRQNFLIRLPDSTRPEPTANVSHLL